MRTNPLSNVSFRPSTAAIAPDTLFARRPSSAFPASVFWPSGAAGALLLSVGSYPPW